MEENNENLEKTSEEELSESSNGPQNNDEVDPELKESPKIESIEDQPKNVEEIDIESETTNLNESTQTNEYNSGNSSVIDGDQSIYLTEQSEENSEKVMEIVDSTFELDIEPFKKIDSDLLEKIKNDSKSLNPIIQKMFETLLKQCFDDFNFVDSPINFEDYMEFYQEVNKIQPKLKKKIPSIQCETSVFFVGDSHGSIEDSFYVIDFFYKILQKDPKAKIIYVGDYVDRNPWDLQNLTLILAFYLLCPNNVVLLRGNHEDKTINIHYGFVDNLLRRFYEKGEELYEEIIKFFQTLPIASIAEILNKEGGIGARVFTVHGGIPVDVSDFMTPIKLDEIESKLNFEVERSELMDSLSVSMLWSDPDEMIQGIVSDDQGTGRMRFGFPVLSSFLQTNNLHLVVRGHQKWKEGFKVFFNGSLFSLFSTSKYDDKKKFDAKILQLVLNPEPQAPRIIPIDEFELEKIVRTY